MADFKDMEKVDLQLHLLAGDSVFVGNHEIPQYTMKEIKDYGYSDYMKNLQWITLSVEDFIVSIKDIEKRMILEVQKKELKPFDFYAKLGGYEMLDGLLNALSMIFKTDDVRVIDESGVIAINFVNQGIIGFDEDGSEVVNNEVLDTLKEEDLHLVHRDNFEEIVEAVKIINYLSKPKVKADDSNPADEETKLLMEHMKKLNKQVEDKKRKQSGNDEEEDINISNIISAVTTKSNSTNKLNVWSYTLYQVYDEYARLELIDNYDFSLRAMMAGAGKIDYRHWSSEL